MAEFQKVQVKLEGQDGNAFAIMARVSRALKRAGYGDDVVNEYKEKAMAGDYTNLLSITCEYADFIDDEDEDDEV